MLRLLSNKLDFIPVFSVSFAISRSSTKTCKMSNTAGFISFGRGDTVFFAAFFSKESCQPLPDLIHPKHQQLRKKLQLYSWTEQQLPQQLGSDLSQRRWPLKHLRSPRSWQQTHRRVFSHVCDRKRLQQLFWDPFSQSTTINAIKPHAPTPTEPRGSELTRSINDSKSKNRNNPKLLTFNSTDKLNYKRGEPNQEFLLITTKKNEES